MMDMVDPKSKTSFIPEEDRKDFVDAAETWRLPFWEFANKRKYNEGEMAIPFCTASGDLNEIGHATDALKSIPLGVQWLNTHQPSLMNPLYSFKYLWAEGKQPSDYGVEGVCLCYSYNHRMILTVTFSRSLIQNEPLAM